MSQEVSEPDPASNPESETSQLLPSFPSPPSAAASDVAKARVANASAGYRSLKPAGSASMDTGQEQAARRSPDIPMQTPSRGLGVQSILNPSYPESQSDEATAPSSSAQQSPYQRSTPQTTHLAPPTHQSPRIRKRTQRGESIDEAQAAPHTSGPRRNLTPISPARRAESLGSRRQLPGLSASVQGSLSAAHEGRIYTVEPGSYPGAEIPPLPTATTFHREAPRIGVRPEGVQPQTRTANSLPGRATGSSAYPASHSESPGTSHSSYSHVSQASPVFNYGTTSSAQQVYQPAYAAPTPSFPYPTSNTPYGESQYSAGQSSYQMALDTEQGRIIVPVEVDLQQASKIADEKRKRNAGASARFRARRKEKEKEAQHSIENMEKEVYTLTDERDFYIRERNYFRDLAMSHIGASQIPPRPASPPLRRALFPPIGSDSSTSQTQDAYRDLPDASPRPAVRRRMGEYRPPHNSAASASPMMPPRMPLTSQYASPGTHLPLPPALPAMQGSYSDARALPSGPPPSRPPPHPPAVSRSQSYDPFRPDLFDKSWDPGR